MKKLLKELAIWASLLPAGLLVAFIFIKWDLNIMILYVFEYLAFAVILVFFVRLMILFFKSTIKQGKVINQTMAETLASALGSEESPLFAEIHAYVLRFDKDRYAKPCFLGLTNTRLLMVAMDPTLTPTQTYGFPLADITFCKIRKSLTPHQHIVTLRFGKTYIKYRIYGTVNRLEKQAADAAYLLNKLRKYTVQPDKRTNL